VATSRATIIDVAAPLSGRTQASTWLESARDDDVGQRIEVLNRALHAFRLVTADPYLNLVSRRQALVARIGFGAGEQVADGRWAEAVELLDRTLSPRRLKVLHPQARLAAVLSGREHTLACEELALRARLDLDHGRLRESALQLLVALDAAVAELAVDPAAATLSSRLDVLRELPDGVAGAAQAALAGPLGGHRVRDVEHALGRIEAALRARAVANA
jgi:protein gp37